MSSSSNLQAMVVLKEYCWCVVDTIDSVQRRVILKLQLEMCRIDMVHCSFLIVVLLSYSGV